MKKILILLLLVPSLGLCGEITLKNDKGNIGHGIKTSPKSGFEMHTNFMGKHEYSFQYLKDELKARAGKYYQRFEVRDGDCFGNDGWDDCTTDRERVELTAEPFHSPISKKCYGYSIMFSDEFVDATPTYTDLGQVHQIGGPSGEAGGFTSFPPLIQVGAHHGNLYFGWHELSGSISDVIDKRRDFKLKSLDQMKGVWTDISFCLDFENKRIDAWIDGKKKVEILKSPINFKPKKIFFKHGIYRSFISQFKNYHDKMPTQIVYYDEVRSGNSVKKVDANINPKLKAVD